MPNEVEAIYLADCGAGKAGCFSEAFPASRQRLVDTRVLIVCTGVNAGDGGSFMVASPGMVVVDRA